MSQNQKNLFTATDHGCVRLYKHPLNGDYVELQAHTCPVVRLATSHDDSMLFSVGTDGCIIMMEVRDKELKVCKQTTGYQKCRSSKDPARSRRAHPAQINPYKPL
eukprot:1184418-Prorocentrum_minimum.AAC.3